MRKLATVVVLLAGLGVAFAACLNDACSDDRDGVLGNERLSWDAVERADFYELGVIQDDGEIVVCESWIRTTSYFLSGTPCDEANTGNGFRVRACNDAGCGPWSEEVVEVLPYACLDAPGCEKPCYHWQPNRDWRRLPSRYEECP